MLAVGSTGTSGGHYGLFDLNTRTFIVGSGNTYPQIGADIPVPQDMGTPDSSLNYGNVTSFGMTLSADEDLLFVAGSTRIVAIDLP